ncbi:hypothetical protein BH23CHL2_BH23CHL2_31030 [soil metagenome]
MSEDHRSGCPINLTVELLGDRWSLVILRDIILLGKRHFRELLESNEGISSNILADRLKMLVDEGMLTRSADPTHKQKIIYSLTEKSIALVPVLAQIAIWGSRHLPVSERPAQLARQLEEGGPAYWEQIMADLRKEHLGIAATNRLQPGQDTEHVTVHRRPS